MKMTRTMIWARNLSSKCSATDHWTKCTAGALKMIMHSNIERYSYSLIQAYMLIDVDFTAACSRSGRLLNLFVVSLRAD
jgi:hypothetical protein